MEKEIVYVRHVPRQSAQGRHAYTFVTSDGNSIPAQKARASGVSVPLGFLRDAESGLLITGLDEMLDNPYYEQNLSDLPSDMIPGSEWRDKYEKIMQMSKISRQTLYEIKDNVAEGTYTAVCGNLLMNSPNITIDSMKAVKPSFLEAFKIYMQEGTSTFTNDSSRGRLAIQVLKNHRKVALSKDSVNEDIHEYYIADIEETIKARNKEINRVVTALQSLGELKADYPSFVMYQMAVILEVAAGEMVDSAVEGELQSYLWETKKTSKGSHEERLEKFTELFKVLKDNRDMLYIKYLIQQALNTGVLRLPSGTARMFWPSKKAHKNVYDLGSNLKKIETMFLNAYEAYDPELDEENWFMELEKELKDKNVKCK
jgi:hypothetical protein